MEWTEELYHQNAFEVRECASTLARLLVDEAEAYLAVTSDRDLDIQEIVEERTSMMMDALYERINQQLTVRGHK